MRMYAYLKAPIPCNKKDKIYKVMIHEQKRDTFVYLYCSPDAVQCSYDHCYNCVDDALEDWNDEIDERGWIKIDDPLPDCQHDAFLPIRVKGRNVGAPQWGKLEILEAGIWKDYPG